MVEDLGKASARAQGLRQPVTCSTRIASSVEQRLYLLIGGRNIVKGLIKVGKKRLFVATAANANNNTFRRSNNPGLREIEPLCVLDFYVHESCQRKGEGKTLFEYMMNAEKKIPSRMGYDRPSPKFLNFLSKHYGLKDYVPQNNNFVVYNRYFNDADPPANTFKLVGGEGTRGGSRGGRGGSAGSREGSRGGSSASSGAAPTGDLNLPPSLGEIEERSLELQYSGADGGGGGLGPGWFFCDDVVLLVNCAGVNSPNSIPNYNINE